MGPTPGLQCWLGVSGVCVCYLPCTVPAGTRRAPRNPDRCVGSHWHSSHRTPCPVLRTSLLQGGVGERRKPGGGQSYFRGGISVHASGKRGRGFQPVLMGILLILWRGSLNSCGSTFWVCSGAEPRVRILAAPSQAGKPTLGETLPRLIYLGKGPRCKSPTGIVVPCSAAPHPGGEPAVDAAGSPRCKAPGRDSTPPTRSRGRNLQETHEAEPPAPGGGQFHPPHRSPSLGLP